MQILHIPLVQILHTWLDASDLCKFCNSHFSPPPTGKDSLPVAKNSTMSLLISIPSTGYWLLDIGYLHIFTFPSPLSQSVHLRQGFPLRQGYGGQDGG